MAFGFVSFEGMRVLGLWHGEGKISINQSIINGDLRFMHHFSDSSGDFGYAVVTLFDLLLSLNQTRYHHASYQVCWSNIQIEESRVSAFLQ
jgi:hypothetical protein